MKLYLIIEKPGLTIAIPGGVVTRTPTKIDISRLNINDVLSELKRQGVEGFYIQHGSSKNKENIKEVKPIPIQYDQIGIQRILDEFRNNSNSNTDERLKNIESLMSQLLENQGNRETIYIQKEIDKGLSSLKKKVDDEEDDEFIPSINLDKLEAKGSTRTSSISSDSIDIEETTRALNRIIKK